MKIVRQRRIVYPPPPTISYRPGDGCVTSLAKTSESTRREAAHTNAVGKHEPLAATDSAAASGLLPDGHFNLRPEQRRTHHTDTKSPISLKLTEAEGMGSRTPDAKAEAAAKRLRSGRFAYRFLKRAFDMVFSFAVLVILSWLFVAIAIAIKIDDPQGPVFFGQERVGKDGKRFRMWKFRSMCNDAEAKLAELQEQNEKDGPVFKMADDPRITRVGHFIRKTSIDELPQFLNVLLGDMSVVGPRPALPKEVAEYTPRQEQRLLVKPGMTCYWQTRRNRDSITFDEWVELDLLYIKKCSVWSDFKLVIQTIGVVLTAQGS